MANSSKTQTLSREDFDRRLWIKVEKHGSDDCWPWIGSTMRNKARTQGGYGMIFAGSKKLGTSNQLYVHRETYKHFVGPIPDGMHVCHTCDNRICCNPAHLFLGTQQDNLKDMFEKRRHAFGTAQPKSKLTDEKVREIRRLYREGWCRKNIAKKFGVARSIICRVLNYQRWSHVV